MGKELEKIRIIAPYGAFVSLIAFFVSNNFQFHLFSIVPNVVSKFMIFFGYGLISISAFSIFLSRYRWSLKIALFIFLLILYFVFHPIKYKTHDLSLYLKHYHNSFQKITQIVDDDSIFSIQYLFGKINVVSNTYKVDYAVFRKNNQAYLEEELKKLNISMIRVDKNQYVFTYAISQFGGFGLIKAKNKKMEEPKTILWAGIKKFEKVNEQWYYFTYD